MANVHENRREKKCTYEGCDYSFNLSGDLNRHLLLHKQGKVFKKQPLRCCNKMFTKTEIIKHKTESHGMRPDIKIEPTLEFEPSFGLKQELKFEPVFELKQELKFEPIFEIKQEKTSFREKKEFKIEPLFTIVVQKKRLISTTIIVEKKRLLSTIEVEDTLRETS